MISRTTQSTTIKPVENNDSDDVVVEKTTNRETTVSNADDKTVAEKAKEEATVGMDGIVGSTIPDDHTGD